MKFKRIMTMVTAAAIAASMCACKKETASDDIGSMEELALTAWYTQGTDFTPGNEVKDNVVQKYVYDKTKVRFENIYGNDGGQWDTKLSRLLTGNNMPHVVICGAGQGPTHVAKLVKAKQLWEITDEMLEQYAPNVKKRIPADLLDGFKINGKLYGLPFSIIGNDTTTQPNCSEEDIQYINECKSSQSIDETMGLNIRDDILKMIYPEAKTWDEIVALVEQTNGPIADELFDTGINTTQDYIDFMYKIKDMKLTENGKDVYAFGYSGGDNWEALTYLGGDMMGYAGQYYTGAWNIVKDEENILLDDDIVKEAAKVQNKMIRDGVIDPESLMHTSEMFKEKVNNGQYAICSASYAGGLNTVNAALEKAGKSYRYRPFYVNIPNLEEYKPGKTKSSWTFSIAFTQELTEKQLIQMLNWMNVCFSDEFEEVFYWGTKEDGLYTENEDGIRTYNDDRFTERFEKGNNAALEIADTKGIGINNGAAGTWYACATNTSRWEPGIYNHNYQISVYNAVRKFRVDSEHIIQTVVPAYNPWSSEFAELDSVITYWAKREQWENPFKLAFASKNDEEFETKWNDALKKLNEIVNVDEMCKEMTEAAKAAQ